VTLVLERVMIGSIRSSRSFWNSTTRPQRSQIRCSWSAWAGIGS
jgi:hypothetical protein